MECQIREGPSLPPRDRLWEEKKKKRSFPCEKVRTGSEPEKQVPSEWPNVRRQTRYVEEGGKVREIWSQLFYFQLRFVVVLI